MKPVNWNFNSEEKTYSVEFQLPEEIDSTTVIFKGKFCGHTDFKIQASIDGDSLKLVYDHRLVLENEFQTRRSQRTWTQTIQIPKSKISKFFEVEYLLPLLILFLMEESFGKPFLLRGHSSNGDSHKGVPPKTFFFCALLARAKF